jgi:hypothetical protein
LTETLGIADDFDRGDRVNMPTRQVASEWLKSAEGKAWLKEHAVAQ